MDLRLDKFEKCASAKFASRNTRASCFDAGGAGNDSSSPRASFMLGPWISLRQQAGFFTCHGKRARWPFRWASRHKVAPQGPFSKGFPHERMSRGCARSIGQIPLSPSEGSPAGWKGVLVERPAAAGRSTFHPRLGRSPFQLNRIFESDRPATNWAPRCKRIRCGSRSCTGLTK
jgi:hypothetical protein